MFTVRSSHGRALLYSPLHIISQQRLLLSTTCRRLGRPPSTSKSADNPLLQAHGPAAEKLAATELWHPIKRRSRAKLATAEGTSDEGAPAAAKKRRRAAASSTSAGGKKPSGDRTRVNIVSDKLCDDIVSYIGSSLERHRGCDILDIYPGAGVWSSKLHQLLQPRSHVLLEPDAELYRPFLQPLLDQPGTTLVPKSGIVWRELTSILTPEYLPHQTVPDDLNVRNDTLLVTANLCFHPKKRFLNFDSMASLVLHQFLDCIRTGGLFQRYGLVRMLIWTRLDDKTGFLPRTVQKRKRQALENDLTCEWVHEVVGNEAALSGWYVREAAIDLAGRVDVINRMRAAKLQMPSGRESESFREALATKRVPVPGDQAPTFKRRYQDVLADLRAANSEQGGFAEDSDERKAMDTYRWRVVTDMRKAERLLLFSQKLREIISLRQSKTATAQEIAAAELEFQMELRGSPKLFVDEFVTYKDNLHAFLRTPPLLQWDRREYEPLEAQAEEFFPNVHCSLLDIQPRAPHPLMRHMGPKSNRAAETFDIVMSSLMHQPTHGVGPGLDGLWPGASDYILPRWKSAQDLSRGGFVFGLPGAEPAPRTLDAGQWEELFKLWMEWPFRPEFNDLVGRSHEFNEEGDDAPNLDP
ncbi:hypothetical protein F5Y01DRAFT_287965 [Xylaria sp. FL0043]|nr:hypothetical protein F5Y01DRAFT_287965 [Xylaria sp. FL0043]